MKKPAVWIGSLVKALDCVWRGACALIIVSIIVVTFAQIVSRKFFNTPFSWTEEFTKLLFVWVNCLGSAVAVRMRSHIQFDFLLTQIMSPAAQNAVRTLTNLLIMGFFLVLLKPTLQLVASMNTIPMAALGWPLGLPHLGYLVGMVAMIFAFLGDCLEAVAEFGGREAA
jgi:TRAP-type C4-dicarboxylate transport system permease small subunit